MVSRFSSLLVACFLCLSLLGHTRTIASTSPKFTQQTSSSPRLEVTQQLSSPKITQQAASSPLEVTQLPSSPKITQQAASLSPKFTQQTLYKSSSQRFTQQALYKSWSPKFTQQALSLTPKFTQQALSSPSKITQQTVSPKFTHQPGPSPPKFTQQPTWPKQTYYDEDGPPIILDCNIKADDSVTILWFKDDQPLSNAMFSWQISNNNQTLTLDPPKKSQTGTYMCYIYNTAGNISYSNYVFIAGRTAVTQPRVIETRPAYQVIHATLGDNVTMFCVFDVGGASTGLLDLTLNWVKNGTLVKDSDHTTWDVSSTLENNQVFYLNISNLKESDYGDYKCVGSNSAGNDSRVLAVSPPQPTSGQDHAWMIVLGSVGGVFLIGTVAMAMLCYHRNQVRNKYQQFDWPDTDLDNYDVPVGDLKYDVFVSYSSEDQDWVMNSLFQTMTENSYEVCIDFKDFTPGMAISENILEAIYKSRKVIVVLSQNFLRSMWGQFELSQALNRAVIQRKDVLILLRYDSCKVPAKLMGKTFLDWTSQDVRPHFWKRLFESVGEPGNYGNQRRTAETCREPDSCRKEMGEVCVEMNGNLPGTEDEGLGTYDLESDKTGVYCTEDVEATGSEAGVMVNDINRKHAMTYSMESDKAELLGNDSDIIDIHGSSIKI